MFYLQPFHLFPFIAELCELIDALLGDDRGVHIEADTVRIPEHFVNVLLGRHHADGDQRQRLQGRRRGLVQVTLNAGIVNYFNK